MRKECYTYWILCLLLLALPQAGRAQRVSSGALAEDVSITRERDSVVIAFCFNLDKMHVESNRSVVLQPLLEGEKESQWLPAVEVMGRKRYIYYERNNRLTYAESPCRVVKKEKDASQQLPYRVALPYQPWMEGASLHLSEDQCGCGALIAHAQEPLAKADITYHPALAYIAYRIYVKRFARKREDVSPEELLPPHEKALMALSQLRDEKLWQGGREKEYYTHLTDILREYLSGRFGIQAMEMTSSQIVEALRSNQETRLLNKQMKEILEMADFVKFAKLKPAPDDNESAMRNAVSFVEETRPQEVPAGDPATPADGSPADSAVQGAPAAKETTPEVSDTQSESDWEKYGPSNKPRL